MIRSKSGYAALWRPGTGEQYFWVGQSVNEFKKKKNQYVNQDLRLQCVNAESRGLRACINTGDSSPQAVISTERHFSRSLYTLESNVDERNIDSCIFDVHRYKPHDLATFVNKDGLKH